MPMMRARPRSPDSDPALSTASPASSSSRFPARSRPRSRPRSPEHPPDSAKKRQEPAERVPSPKREESDLPSINIEQFIQLVRRVNKRASRQELTISESETCCSIMHMSNYDALSSSQCCVRTMMQAERAHRIVHGLHLHASYWTVASHRIRRD